MAHLGIASSAATAALLLTGAASGTKGQTVPPLPDPPPIKAAPWTPPPNRLPKEFVEAVVFLQAHGLPDPRGGVFGEDRVTGKDPSGRTLTSVAARGWLMPGTKEIVHLNGTRAPLWGEFRPTPQAYRRDPVTGWLWLRGSLTLSAVMFFVRGDAELARNLIRLDDRGLGFVDVAEGFLAAKFHAALEPHKWGDDATAFKRLQELRALRPLYEAKAVATLTDEEIRRRTEYSFPPVTNKSRIFPFLSALDDLAFDSWRRLNTPKRRGDPKRITNQSKRIEALILDIENVSVQQRGQPGSVHLHRDSKVEALVKEGDAAIEPLIKAMESDKRLTRSVGYWRDFSPLRAVVSVASAARVAIEEIIGLEMSQTGDISKYIAEVRQVAKETRGMTRAERWMHLLKDESTPFSHWWHSALCLLDREHIRRKGGGISWSLRVGDPLPPIRAEALKDLAHPSLIEILSKRFDELLKIEQTEKSSGENSLTLALKVHEWDPTASFPLLQKAVRLTFKKAISSDLSDRVPDLLAKAVVRLHKLGDEDCLNEWAGTVQISKPFVYAHRARALDPLYELRDEPLMKNLTEDLFLVRASQWNPSNQSPGSKRYAAVTLARSRLIELEPVRVALGRLLTDRAAIGEVTLRKNRIEVKFRSSLSSGTTTSRINLNSGEAITESQELLEADYVAAGLAELHGAPKFELLWSRERKDQALAEMKAFIEKIRKVEEVYPGFKDENYPL